MCGRLNHAAAGGLQTGADLQRVQELMKILPETYVELEAGKSKSPAGMQHTPPRDIFNAKKIILKQGP